MVGRFRARIGCIGGIGSSGSLGSIRAVRGGAVGLLPRGFPSLLEQQRGLSTSSISVDPPFASFRTFPHVHWYPGHMEKALRQMRERIHHDQIGVMLEVRDARVPLSSAHHFDNLDSRASVGRHGKRRGNGKASPMIFRDSWGQRYGMSIQAVHRIVLYNKVDLVDGPTAERIFHPPLSASSSLSLDPRSSLPQQKHYFQQQQPSQLLEEFLRGNVSPSTRTRDLPLWRRLLLEKHEQHAWMASDHSRPSESTPPPFFSNIREGSAHGIDGILLEAVRHWVRLHHPAMRATPLRPYPPLHILVAGLPNTGKSTLINALRVYGLGYGSTNSSKKKVAAVGKNPGETKCVSGKIKIVDTETFALGHALATPLGRRQRLEAETPVARLLRSMNIRLKVYVMDSPGVLPPHIPDKHVAVKLALAGCLPNDPSGIRGADTMLLCEYLWWRMRERWGIGPQVLQAIGWPHSDSNDPSLAHSSSDADALPTIDTLLRHLALCHLQNKQPSKVQHGADQRSLGNREMEMAADQFLSLWRTGNLYRRMGLFASTNLAANQRRPTKKEIALSKDVWRVTLLDDEIALEEVDAFKRYSENG